MRQEFRCLNHEGTTISKITNLVIRIRVLRDFVVKGS